MVNPVSSERPIQFSLIEGGPFHTVLAKLGLLGKDRLPTWRTALVLALVAWIPPAILAITQSLLYADYSGWGFFTDGTVYTRYVVAIMVMVATERFADGRISILVNQFLQARLLDADVREKFRDIVAQADRRVSWSSVEGILLLIALVWSWVSFYFISTVSVSGWEEWTTGGGTQLSWAGTAGELLANPVFLFLVLRWFWRFLVWTMLLAQVARLPLRLTAVHPDKSGGLIFLAMFPAIFSGFVFALSCVASSSLIKSMALLPQSQAFIWFAIGGWVLMMALIFLAPLFLFSAPLYRAREQALIEYGRLAQIHHQAFHDAWVSGGRDTEEMLGHPDPSSVADLNVCVEAVLDMKIVPLDRDAVLQLVVAAFAPFLVFLALRMPLAEILKWILGVIL
ncbi:hypothetical protein ACFL3I_13390 [Pseudomonadota bacterium]